MIRRFVCLNPRRPPMPDSDSPSFDSSSSDSPSSDPQQLAIDALRAAVAAAPGQEALAVQLVELLLGVGRDEEAEQAARVAADRNRRSATLSVLMARVFYRRGKDSHAAAILETLIDEGRGGSAAGVLMARLQQRRGDTRGAVATYRDAVDADPDARDRELESLLGLDETFDDDDERLKMPAGGLPFPGDDEDDDDGDPDLVPRAVDGEGFDSVGGMEPVKEQIRMKIIYPLQHADMYAAYGKKVGGGILLYGPPGCGKTHLARATAGEVGAKFLSVGISDVLDMYIGSSEKNLRAIFQRARRDTPCVLFFDEVDALGAKRSDMRSSGGRQLINQFLSELDGLDGDNEGLLILGATNTPWHLDTALRRPGRFERVVFVPPPDADGRAAILRIHLRGKPSDGVDVGKVAAKTEGFSGADLKSVVDGCVEDKLAEAIRTGAPKPITTADLVKAAKRTRATTAEWFGTARNHALFANEGGVYDEVLSYLKVKR